MDEITQDQDGVKYYVQRPGSERHYGGWGEESEGSYIEKGRESQGGGGEEQTYEGNVFQAN